MALFSVVIPTFNRASLILEALQSVFDQSYRDYEVIVVDDGSTDDTSEVIAASGFDVRYVRQENMGVGTARNYGVMVSSGPIIAFLDSDDLWFPWALETYKRAFESNSELSWVAGSGVEFRNLSELEGVGRSEYRQDYYPDYLATSKDGVWVGTCAAAVRRETFLQAGGFLREKICAEDSDLWLKLGGASGFAKIHEPPVFAYRRHSESAVGDLQKSVAGMDHLINSEIGGLYPGGERRERDRTRIITRHVRPITLRLSKEGGVKESFRLFLRTLRWNLRELRFRYLIALPIFSIIGSLRKLKRRRDWK